MDDYRDVDTYYRKQLEMLLKQAGFRLPDAYGIFSKQDRKYNEDRIRSFNVRQTV